jgi:hypothetical protein
MGVRAAVVAVIIAPLLLLLVVGNATAQQQSPLGVSDSASGVLLPCSSYEYIVSTASITNVNSYTTFTLVQNTTVDSQLLTLSIRSADKYVCQPTNL